MCQIVYEYRLWRKIIESWIDGEYDKNKGNTVHKCPKLEKLYFGILAYKDQTHNIEKKYCASNILYNFLSLAHISPFFII